MVVRGGVEVEAKIAAEDVVGVPETVGSAVVIAAVVGWTAADVVATIMLVVAIGTCATVFRTFFAIVAETDAAKDAQHKEQTNKTPPPNSSLPYT